MNEPTHSATGTIPAAGLLEGISIPDLLWSLCRDRRTGTLNVWSGQTHKSVYFEEGRIVFSTSNDPDDRLGEILLRGNDITLDERADAVSRLGEGKRLGALLVESGHLSTDGLVDGVLSQVREVVLSLFTWTAGGFRFEDGPLPTDEVIKLNMNTSEVLLQGIRRIRSFARIRASVGSPQTYFRAAPDIATRAADLELTEGEEMLVRRLEASGGDAVERLCDEIFLSNFEIYQALWAFKVLGLIEEAERPADTLRDATFEGRLDGQGIAPQLVRLARDGETGVLYLTRGSQERTIQFREGRCIFATSNDFEDGLLAHLLRRGVISIRDRNETAKRLLSNKRVGTILREIGAIDDRDLDVMVREQLTALIHDSLRWTDGEYAFVAGELPTIEEITLSISVESLLSSGLSRITSWSRIDEGCGGVDTAQVLAPSYLEVLDRMEIGSDEWTVVSALTEPHSVTELARATGLPGFRVGQITWILRALGAVETAPEQPATEDLPSFAAAADVAASPDDTQEFTSPYGTTEFEPSPDAETEEPEAPAEIPVAAEENEETEAFEVTDIHATLSTPEESEQAIAPSEWEEPEDADRLEADRLAPEVDPDASLQVSEAPAEAELEHDVPPLPAETAEADEADEAHEEGWSDSIDATQYIKPEDVEAALVHDDEPEREEVDTTETAEFEAPDEVDEVDEVEPPAPRKVLDPNWEPPADLDELIERLNDRQRILYRTIRAEIGAGAANFVRSCAGKLAGDAEQLFTAVELYADGTWDREALYQAVHDQQPEDPSIEYERLIELEVEQLRGLIGEHRAQAVYDQIIAADGAHGDDQTARPPE